MNLSTSICTNRQNIAELYKEYREMICRYITARIPNKYEAVDLTQDVFLRLHNINVIIDKDTAKSLLLTIARNLITDTLRRYYKKEYVMSTWNEEYTFYTPTAEDELIANEVEDVYTKSVDKLPPKSKKIYYLMINDEMSASKIATMLSLSKRTIESTIYNAKLRVRNAVLEYS